MEKQKGKDVPLSRLEARLIEVVLSVDVPRAKFCPGQLNVTDEAREVIHPMDWFAGVGLHLLGDWGEVPRPRRISNEKSLKDGLSILSTYRDRNGIGFHVLTFEGRRCTEVILQDEERLEPSWWNKEE